MALPITLLSPIGHVHVPAFAGGKARHGGAPAGTSFILERNVVLRWPSDEGALSTHSLHLWLCSGSSAPHGNPLPWELRAPVHGVDEAPHHQISRFSF